MAAAIDALFALILFHQSAQVFPILSNLTCTRAHRTVAFANNWNWPTKSYEWNEICDLSNGFCPKWPWALHSSKDDAPKGLICWNSCGCKSLFRHISHRCDKSGWGKHCSYIPNSNQRLCKFNIVLSLSGWIVRHSPGASISTTSHENSQQLLSHAEATMLLGLILKSCLLLLIRALSIPPSIPLCLIWFCGEIVCCLARFSNDIGGSMGIATNFQSYGTLL